MFGDFIHECTPQTMRDATGRTKYPLSDAQVADVVRRYLASVTDVDTMFGEILDTARHLGMLDDTIVIFWSGDHGFFTGRQRPVGEVDQLRLGDPHPAHHARTGDALGRRHRARPRRGG